MFVSRNLAAPSHSVLHSLFLFGALLVGCAGTGEGTDGADGDAGGVQNVGVGSSNGEGASSSGGAVEENSGGAGEDAGTGAAGSQAGGDGGGGDGNGGGGAASGANNAGGAASGANNAGGAASGGAGGEPGTPIGCTGVASECIDRGARGECGSEGLCISMTEASCWGTSVECLDLNASECDADERCGMISPTYCAPTCMWDDEGVCQLRSDCTSYPGPSDCYEVRFSGCEWTETACLHRTRTWCSDQSIEECTQVPGCELVYE